MYSDCGLLGYNDMSLTGGYQCFGETCHLYVQGRASSKIRIPEKHNLKVDIKLEYNFYDIYSHIL
jgi:hypothetical protein